MDWSKIKTIFIIAFLILNIYLANEFKKLYDSRQYDVMSEATFENKLQTEQIKTIDLPKNIRKDKYISAAPKKFVKEELEKYTNDVLKNQTVIIRGETTLESILKEPHPLITNLQWDEIDQFVQQNVLEGDQYYRWKINEGEKTITYYQRYGEKTLYKNINGELTLYYNDKHEIIAYKQTLLEKFEELSEDENLLQPMKALEILYDNGELPFGSNVTKVELGYYTLVHLTTSQVLTPVWRFVINDNNLFVNAIDGQIIQLDNEDKKIVE